MNRIKIKNCYLYHGDCLDIMPRLPKSMVDLVITDPPYRITITGLTRRTPAFDKLKNHKWINEMNWLQPLSSILKDGAAFYIFTCDDDISDLRRHLKQNDMRVNSRLTWIKTNPLPSYQKVAYRNSTELALYGNKGKHVKYFAKKPQQELLGYWLLPIVGGAERTKHPTQKPLKLIKEWIENSSIENELVFDPFMGSGTTGVACINTNRRFIGIEKDDEYFEIAKQRIMEASNE